MAISGRTIFTIVDFGSSKITILHCRRDRAGNPEVAAHAQRSTEGSIIKGQIRDRKKLETILAATLADADNVLGSSSIRGNVYYIISGSDITSRSGIGNIVIYGEDNRLTADHVKEAVEKAENITLAQDQIILDYFQTAFILDSSRRVFDPVGDRASRMEAIVHIIIANKNRLADFGAILFNLGFEGEIIPLFSGVCSAYGALTSDERNDGVLLVDMGAGTTDYFVVVQEGVAASGVLPVGIDNLANDISLGLGISMETARKILHENIYQKLQLSGESTYEFNTAGDKSCVIPFASLDKIIAARMNETMVLLKQQLEKEGVFELIRSGVVLTGGGALVPAALDFAASVTGLHVRAGKATDVSGALTGLDSPRYTAALGASKLILSQYADEGTGGTIDKMTEALENLTGGLFNSVRRLKKVIR